MREASANKPGMGARTEDQHNRLPLLFSRGWMYRGEGPDGLVKDIPRKGADGIIKPSPDQCDTASAAPFSMSLTGRKEICLFPLQLYAMFMWCECLECAHIHVKS